MSGHVRSEHAAVGRPVAAGDRGDVRRPLLLPQGLQRRVADLAGRLQDVPGLRLPLRSHAQVPSPQDAAPVFNCSDLVLHPGACVSRLEQTKEDESKDALKDLVNLVTCLTTYGVTELKPAGLTTGAPFLLPGFVLPQPSAKGLFTSKAFCFSAAVIIFFFFLDDSVFFLPSNQFVPPEFIISFCFVSLTGKCFHNFCFIL